MNKDRRINLYGLLKVRVLSTRRIVSLIESHIKENIGDNEKFVVIDCSEIEQISRSFADSLLSLKEKLESKGMEMTLDGLNDFNKKMMEMVARSRRQPRKEIADTVQGLSEKDTDKKDTEIIELTI